LRRSGLPKTQRVREWNKAFDKSKCSFEAPAQVAKQQFGRYKVWG
jgi:hypothetical protein